MFDQWMKEIDEILERDADINSQDLPDQPYRDWFNDELSAKEAAHRALYDSGFYDFDFDEDEDYE